MDKAEYLLVCIAEESGEIAQAAHKALRFGIDDGYPGTDRTNRRDIVQEVNDLLGVLGLLVEHGVQLDGLFDREAIEAKKAKVRRFMAYSEERGSLEAAAKERGE